VTGALVHHMAGTLRMVECANVCRKTQSNQLLLIPAFGQIVMSGRHFEH
jgi:hypothetical protein